MICEKCGRNIPGWESECSKCSGTTTFYSDEPVRIEPKLTREQFNKHPNMKPVKKQITSYAIWMYVIVVLNIPALLLLEMANILDILIVAGCAVVLQVKQSRTAAIVFLVYTVINFVITLAVYGRGAGWVLILLAVKAYSSTNRLQSYWKRYQITGDIPYASRR